MTSSCVPATVASVARTATAELNKVCDVTRCYQISLYQKPPWSLQSETRCSVLYKSSGQAVQIDGPTAQSLARAAHVLDYASRHALLTPLLTVLVWRLPRLA